MKFFALFMVLGCFLILVRDVHAERTSTRLTARNVDKQPLAFTIKVDRVKDIEKGEFLEFHVRVRPKDPKFPLSPRRLGELEVFDGKKFVSSCLVQSSGRGSAGVSYSFRVAAQYVERSRFSFDENIRGPVGPEGAYYWFYVKDFFEAPEEK